MTYPEVKIPEDVLRKSTHLRDKQKGKWRDHYNGSPENRLVGIVGQAAAHMFLFKKPYHFVHSKEWDGGYDMVYANKKIDVKTVKRTCYVHHDYHCNVAKCQAELPCDVYLFCSYHVPASTVQLVGWIDKADMIKPERLIKKGTRILRSDGSGLVIKETAYFIEIRNLNPMYKLLIKEEQIKQQELI